jgi:hypothetical protein
VRAPEAARFDDRTEGKDCRPRKGYAWRAGGNGQPRVSARGRSAEDLRGQPAAPGRITLVCLASVLPCPKAGRAPGGAAVGRRHGHGAWRGHGRGHRRCWNQRCCRNGTRGHRRRTAARRCAADGSGLVAAAGTATGCYRRTQKQPNHQVSYIHGVGPPTGQGRGRIPRRHKAGSPCQSASALLTGTAARRSWVGSSPTARRHPFLLRLARPWAVFLLHGRSLEGADQRILESFRTIPTCHCPPVRFAHAVLIGAPGQPA